MKNRAFVLGVLAICVGVLLHAPDYVAARHQHFMMAGMGMSTMMKTGMLLILSGLVLAAWSLLPKQPTLPRTVVQGSGERFVALDSGQMGPAHRKLVGVLTIGLVVDTMKPATLGFVVPALAQEYEIPVRTASMLTVVALCGTVIGSLVWGRMADIYGRRATILLSALMYIATCVCGFMPSFGWNLVMCFLMGAAAGGMLPTVYSLTFESIPGRYRGWVIVLMTGVGASFGYLAASGAATLIEPSLSWRTLWLLGAPTGMLLLLLSRWIPESPRFLLLSGRLDEAREVMGRYGIVSVPVGDTPVTSSEVQPGQSVRQRFLALFDGDRYRTRSLVIVLYGLGWGVANWGFLTFLPTYLATTGISGQANGLLFVASLLAVPGTAMAAVLYARWGGKPSMLLYAAATAVVLAAFAAIQPARPGFLVPFILLTTVFLFTSNGMVAMLSPYTAEVYPTMLRASGSGLAAAATKAGGMFGPLLLTSAPGIGTLALITMVPVTVAAVTLWRLGPETATNVLNDIDTESLTMG